MSVARPSLIERLQAQVQRLEREAEHLRKLDRSMSEQLRRAIDEADRLRKGYATQAEALDDLRRQLAARATEVDGLRADLAETRNELAMARIANPVVTTAPAESKAIVAEPTRIGLLEVD